MSDFAPGFSSRRAQAAAEALQRAFAVPTEGFAAECISNRVRKPEAPVTPRHFSPADPAHKATEGWDMFEPDVAPEPQPFVDPVAAARALGYEEGLAAGRAEVEAAQAREEALLHQLSEALAKGAHFDRERMAGHLRQTVLHLVTRLVGEVGVAPDVLAGRIDAAIDLLADEAESAILRVHPEDMPILEGRLPNHIFAAADPHVARGGFVIESASTIVEDGPELWLGQLAEAIDRVPIPPAC